MRYSQLFGKTNKDAKEFDSINATLLQKGGFIEQVMSGVYTFLPLGLRVLNKIENIVRAEMNQFGPELLMTTLAPKEIWQTTGRIETVDVLLKASPANAVAAAKHQAEYIINPTHEDVIASIARHFNTSYKDFPFAVYQIQTKFRNEPRAKSGLLRGREFRMKDLYSFHASEADFKEFYERVKESYRTIFNQLGLGQDTFLTLASGGDFTKDYSHEFQTICETGEDTVYLNRAEGIAYNKEVAPADLNGLEEVRGCEVANLFPLGTRFPEAFGYTFSDASGQAQPITMGSYGIGTSRIMGVLVEKFHDEAGIIWPAAVAPYRVHLIGLNLEDEAAATQVQAAYQELTEQGIEVLFDDRVDTSAGTKFADADLLGIPWRVVISKRTKGNCEVKQRSSSEAEHLSLSELRKRLA